MLIDRAPVASEAAGRFRVKDVAKAIAEGKFHLYAVATVAQGIEVLTGVPAGERDGSGRFPASPK